MQYSYAHILRRTFRLPLLPLLFQFQVLVISGQRADILNAHISSDAESGDASSASSRSPLVSPTDSPQSEPDCSSDALVPQGALLRVQLSELLNISRLRSGSPISGTLVRPLYCQDRAIVPIGSKIGLVAEKIKKDQPERSWTRKLAEHVWNPLSKEEARYSVEFRSSVLKLPDGRIVPIQVSFGRLVRFVKVQPKSTKQSATVEATSEKANGSGSQQSLQSPQGASKKSNTLILRLESSVTFPFPLERQPRVSESHNGLPNNSTAKLCLLTRLSASQNRKGDSVQARLVEPVQLDGKVIPEGSSFEGRVVQQRAPRRLRRTGSLFVNFERIVTPSGLSIPINSSFIGIEFDRRERIRMDSEGMLYGSRPGLAAYAVDLGISYAAGKIIDDLIEEGIKAAVAGATSETAASIGRYFGMATGVSLFLMRRGRDVTLEQYSEFEVTFKSRVEEQRPENHLERKLE